MLTSYIPHEQKFPHFNKSMQLLIIPILLMRYHNIGVVLLALCNVAMDDMYNMSQTLKSFNKSRWKVLGRQLGLKSNLLDEINPNYQQNGVGEGFDRVLEAWLKRNYNETRFGPPTWHSLANAV